MVAKNGPVGRNGLRTCFMFITAAAAAGLIDREPPARQTERERERDRGRRERREGRKRKRREKREKERGEGRKRKREKRKEMGNSDSSLSEDFEPPPRRLDYQASGYRAGNLRHLRHF